MDVLKKHKWTVTIVALVVILLALLAPRVITTIKYNSILSHNNITSEMQKNTNAYRDKKLGDHYLVYLYSAKNDKKVNEYADQISKYEKTSNAVKIYKVDLDKLPAAKVTDNLFIDDRYGTMISVKNGEEDYRYRGNFPIDKMSHN